MSARPLHKTAQPEPGTPSLRENEDTFRAIADSAQDAVIMIDNEGEVSFWNKAAERMFGYTNGDAVGRTISSLIVPERLREKHREGFSRFRTTGEGLLIGDTVEMPARRKDGTEFPVELSLSAMKINGKWCATGVLRDITERRKTEEHVRSYQEELRALALETARLADRERQRIATDLHDGISQTLSMANLKLGELRIAVNSPDAARAVDDVRDLINQAVHYTRSLTLELAPPVLRELGLSEALEWLAEQVRDRHHIPVVVACDPCPNILDDELKTVVFKAVSEALMNVVRHAHAGKAEVSLKLGGGALRVEVRDDGAGFDASKVRPFGKTGGFGLFYTAERIKGIGGRFEITSEPGKGTRVVIEVPVS